MEVPKVLQRKCENMDILIFLSFKDLTCSYYKVALPVSPLDHTEVKQVRNAWLGELIINQSPILLKNVEKILIKLVHSFGQFALYFSNQTLEK